MCGERLAVWTRGPSARRRARLAQARRHLDGLARVLDGISYRAVLERGFALVRGEDGKVRRRAGAMQAGRSA